MSKQLDDLLGVTEQTGIADSEGIDKILRRLGDTTFVKICECTDSLYVYIASNISKSFNLDIKSIMHMKLEELIYILKYAKDNPDFNLGSGNPEYNNYYFPAILSGFLTRSLIPGSCYEVRQFLHIDINAYLISIQKPVCRRVDSHLHEVLNDDKKVKDIGGMLSDLASPTIKMYLPGIYGSIDFTTRIQDSYLCMHYVLVEGLYKLLDLDTRYSIESIKETYQIKSLKSSPDPNNEKSDEQKPLC